MSITEELKNKIKEKVLELYPDTNAIYDIPLCAVRELERLAWVEGYKAAIADIEQPFHKTN